MHMTSYKSASPPSACAAQDAHTVEVHPQLQPSASVAGSSGQAGQDQGYQQQAGSAAQAHPAGQQASSSGQAEAGCDIADRLRAAVDSRGFEPCPPSTDNVGILCGTVLWPGSSA